MCINVITVTTGCPHVFLVAGGRSLVGGAPRKDTWTRVHSMFHLPKNFFKVRKVRCESPVRVAVAAAVTNHMMGMSRSWYKWKGSTFPMEVVDMLACKKPEGRVGAKNNGKSRDRILCFVPHGVGDIPNYMHASHIVSIYF